MTVPKNYFHDRMILLLLSIGSFLALLGVVIVLWRMGGGQSGSYFVQYRANLGISAFKTGGSQELLAFALFTVMVLVFSVVLSMRVYHPYRQFALAVLGLGLLLQVVSIFVSNALLGL